MFVVLVCFLLACNIVFGDPSLNDPPLLSDGLTLSLEGPWTLTSGEGVTYPANVPGDHVTDLERAGLLGDPLFSQNWRTQAHLWNSTTWTYTRSFSTPFSPHPSTLLVFDGVKMVADLFINGVSLGDITNQHMRYTFEVGGLLHPVGGPANELQVKFPVQSEEVRNDLEARYMACSGGWDWGQTSTDFTPKSLPFLSFGIWKSVSLVQVPHLSLVALKALTFFTGPYATEPLTDATAGPWRVDVSLYLAAGPSGAPATTLGVVGSWQQGGEGGGEGLSVPVEPFTPGESRTVNVSLVVPLGAVKLWWPNGVALPVASSQALYTLTASLVAPAPVPVPAVASGATTTTPINITATRTLGFRSLALVTADDSSPEALANLTGSGNYTVRLRVNGVSIFARGSNIIPLDEYAGRANASALCLHLRSAALAGMNLLLVWGGGIFQYEPFYACADQYGLLLYQDLMYSAESAPGFNSAHMIQATASQGREIRYNVRRLAHHPSLALWAGGNEIGGGGLYASFGLTTVASEDGSRPVWPSSPSSGWASGVDRLWGHPLPAAAGEGVGVGVGWEPLAVNLAPAPPPNSTSRIQPNVYYMGFERSASTSSSSNSSSSNSSSSNSSSSGGGGGGGGPPDCGALCGSTPGCVVANIQGQTCGLRGFGFPVSAWGVTWGSSVFPPSTPLPLPLPPAPCRIETHGPYLGGSGWPAVNSGGGSSASPFDPEIPPPLPPPPGPPMGVTSPGHYFISEFGTTSFSSFESMAPTLPQPSWGIHGPDLFWRSYSQDNVILSYFGGEGVVNRSGVGDAALFARQLLASTLGAALNLKSQLEVQRGGNSQGALLWQLGEIWPTGGWGSLEYAHAHTATQGQVAGGRWKPLHHWLQAVLFKDLLVACGAGASCYARNDSPMAPFMGTARFTAVSVASGESFPLGGGVPLTLPKGPAAAQYFCPTTGALQGPCEPWDAVLEGASGGVCNTTSCILLAELVVEVGGASGTQGSSRHSGDRATTNVTVVASNPTLLAPPYALLPYLHPNPTINFTLQDPPPPVGQPIAIHLTLSAPVLFLTLTTLAQGHFDRNSELLTLAGNSTITFLPLDTAGSDTFSLLQDTLTVRHF